MKRQGQEKQLIMRGKESKSCVCIKSWLSNVSWNMVARTGPACHPISSSFSLFLIPILLKPLPRWSDYQIRWLFGLQVLSRQTNEWFENLEILDFMHWPLLVCDITPVDSFLALYILPNPGPILTVYHDVPWQRKIKMLESLLIGFGSSFLVHGITMRFMDI